MCSLCPVFWKLINCFAKNSLLERWFVWKQKKYVIFYKSKRSFWTEINVWREPIYNLLSLYWINVLNFCYIYKRATNLLTVKCLEDNLNLFHKQLFGITGFLMGQPGPLFCFIFGLSNKQYIFYNKSMWKNVQIFIQYTVPGFEPTTLWTWVVTH